MLRMHVHPRLAAAFIGTARASGLAPAVSIDIMNRVHARVSAWIRIDGRFDSREA
jgi:hypothetical protein